jgi:hypothetical protein
LCEHYSWAKVVKRADLVDYADTVPEIRKTLDAYHYHAVIVPYRGALKPWLQLSVLAQHADTIIELPFTGASQRKNDERLRWYLWQGLARFFEEGELRIAVVDTGEGGHGSVTITDLLRQCHREDQRRKWFVDIHLIHKRGEFGLRAVEVRRSGEALAPLSASPGRSQSREHDGARPARLGEVLRLQQHQPARLAHCGRDQPCGSLLQPAQ